MQGKFASNSDQTTRGHGASHGGRLLEVMTVFKISAAALVVILTVCSVHAESGIAAFYDGGRTASGEVSQPTDLTAAHKTLPFGAMVKVTNLSNGRSVLVRINDRGPYGRNRIIDVSRAAARELDMVRSGTVRVNVDLQ